MAEMRMSTDALIGEWADVIPRRYEPAKLTRDKAARPKTVKRALKECMGTEAADVIVALVQELCAGRERERYFMQKLKEANQVLIESE